MYVAFVVHARGSVPHDLREASPGMRTDSGPLRFNATRSLYVTVRVVIVRLVGRPRHEPVRMIDRLCNKVTLFLSSGWSRGVERGYHARGGAQYSRGVLRRAQTPTEAR